MINGSVVEEREKGKGEIEEKEREKGHKDKEEKAE